MVAPRTTGGGNRGLPTRHHYAGGLLASSKSGSEDQYYHQDRLGSVANLSGGDATASDDYKYDPFGGVRAQPAPSATDNRFSFTGQQRDESTGLYYYDARFYDSSIGRFLTQDTWAGAGAEPQSLNKYLYAYSNPGRFTDPTGHQNADMSDFCSAHPEWCVAPSYPAPDPSQTPGAPPTYSGAAPSVTKAYTNGGEAFGVAFPLKGQSIRAPTPADAGGFPHYMEGGHTAVRGAGPDGGMLTNSTREFVTPGGASVPAGSVFFKLGPNGEWIPLRRF